MKPAQDAVPRPDRAGLAESGGTEARLHEAGRRLAGALERARDAAGRAAVAADRTVHRKPYHVIALAASLGFACGFLAARRGACRERE